MSSRVGPVGFEAPQGEPFAERVDGVHTMLPASGAYDLRSCILLLYGVEYQEEHVSLLHPSDQRALPDACACVNPPHDMLASGRMYC